MGSPRIIALTATATKIVQDDILKNLQLKNTDIQIFHQGITRPNLRLEADEYMSDSEKVDEIIRIYKNHEGSGIVYFSLIKTLSLNSEKLDEKKIPHLVYHGKLDKNERRKVQNLFMDSQMLILATNSFGREYVEDQLFYKNRFDFRLDTALNLFERNHITSGTLHQKNIKLLMEKLLSIVQYFRSEKCRRGEIETYFGFEDEPDCMNCDTCNL